MGNIAEHGDLPVIHPGRFMAEVLAWQNISRMEFAREMGMSPAEVDCLLGGGIMIGTELAEQLEEVLGIDRFLWLNLQAEYDRETY